MSDSSRNDSSGSVKSLRGRITLGRKQGSDAADTIKKSFSHVTDLTKNMGSTFQNRLGNKKESASSVFSSKGVRELDEFGYEKFNINDEAEIFISRMPERSTFNEGEPYLVRANGGEMVSNPDVHSRSARFQVDEPVVQGTPSSVRDHFVNVTTGTFTGNIDTFTGSVGPDGKIEHTSAPVYATDLFSKMSRPAVNVVEETPAEEPETEHIEAPAEAPTAAHEEISETRVEEEFTDGDSEILIITPGPVEEPVAEAAEEPVETPVGVQAEEPVVEVPAEPVKGRKDDISLFDDVEDEPVVEVPQADDDWRCEDDETGVDPVTFESIVNDLATVPAEEPVAETTIEAPAEEPVVEASVEAFAEEPVEIPAEPEVAPVADVPEEIPAEAPAEVQVSVEIPAEPVAEAPAEGLIATPALRAVETDQIEGLYKEGSEPSSCAIRTEDVAKPMQAQTAKTSGSDVLEPVARIGAMDESGAEILPPLSEPTRRRPPTRRFCFKDGVLTSVPETTKKDEPSEELRVPFDGTVDEAVTPEVPADALELKDEVADLMKLTVPELDTGEDWTGICMDQDLPDDGCAKMFADAIVRDEARAAAESAVEMYRAAIPDSPVDPAYTVTFSFGEPVKIDGSKVYFSF